jgi:tetratricopeptide (TPR) repeat protein
MRGSIVLFAVVLAFASVGRAETIEDVSKRESVPDTTYEPRRGDRAVLGFYDKEKDALHQADCAKYSFAYEDYWKSSAIKDYAGMDELVSRGTVLEPAIGTEVLVIEIEEFPAKDPRANCAVVRIMDGPYKGIKVWTSTVEVTRMIPNPRREPTAPAAAPAPVSYSPSLDYRLAKALEDDGQFDAAVAAYLALVQRYPASEPAKKAEERVNAIMARVAEARAEIKVSRVMLIAVNLERSGKIEAALVYYRQVVKEAPKSHYGEMAAERIKALGGK